MTLRLLLEKFCKIFFWVFLLFVPFHVGAQEKKLTLRDAVFQAIKHSPEVEVIQGEFSETILDKKKAVSNYLPEWKSSFSREKNSSPSVFQTDTQGTNFLITNRFLEFKSGIFQKLPTDGEFFTEFSTERIDTTSSNVLLSPFYSNKLEFGLKQPLLKGFDWFGSFLGNSWVDLRIASKSRNQSKWEFQEALAEIIFKVEAAYDSFLGAKESLEARRKAERITKKQLDIVGEKIRAGLLVVADAYQVSERLESRRAQRFLTEQEYVQAKVELARLMGLDGESSWVSIRWKLDAPSKIPLYPLKSKKLIERIQQKNFLLKALEEKVNSKRMEMNKQKNQWLPTFDFEGSFFLLGGNNPTTTSYGSSLDELLDTRSHGWEVEVTLDVPLGPRPDYQEYRKSRLEYFKVKSERALEAKRLMAEGLTLLNKVNAEPKRIRTLTRSVSLAEKKLEFEQKKFGSGLTTSFSLLQFQEDLTDARLRAVQAIVEYRNAIAKLDKLAARTLEKYQIQVNEADGLWVARIAQD